MEKLLITVDNIYSDISKYSWRLINRNFNENNQSCMLITSTDLVNECYSVGFNTLDEAKKIMRNYLINEHRKQKGQRQFSGISASYEKLCKNCNTLKNQSEFRHQYDVRYDLHYLYYICFDCERKYNTSEDRKKRRREWYKNNDRAKAKARERYLRWKERQKLNNGKTFNKNK